MRQLREFAELMRETLVPPPPGQGRPTSVDAAGTVGTREPVRRPALPPPGEDRLDDGEVRRRPAVRPLSQQASRVDRAAALRVALQDPESLRTAMLLREVLGPPLALRDGQDL